jgi:hypothetical protein
LTRAGVVKPIMWMDLLPSLAVMAQPASDDDNKGAEVRPLRT